MNKASFSRLIVDSTYLSDGDVQALEQVVQAFPYCQTAHMLLAKAASDKGSMLAPQRLRKAAIHAPSRALLKKLVEGKLNQPNPANFASNGFSKSTQTAYNEEIEDLLENDLPEQMQVQVVEPKQTEKTEPETEILLPEAAAETEVPVREELIAALEEEGKAVIPEQTLEEETVITPTIAETEEEVIIAETVPEELEEIGFSVEQEEIESAVLLGINPVPPASEETEAAETTDSGGLGAFLAGLQDQTHLTETEAPELQPDLSELRTNQAAVQTQPEETLSGEEVIPDKETGETNPEAKENPEQEIKQEEIQVQAESEVLVTPLPEILAETETETEEKQLARELTPLNEADSALAPDAATLAPDYSDSLIFSIFRDNELGYAMSSSRMGESLELRSELTREVPFHFQPELLVEYRHTRTEPETNLPEEPKPVPQQDLINDFLKQASKTRPRANMLPKAEEQEDLSQKSTRLSKTIVSENLAQIFAMQGKTKKAIKIYQQLQLKMPEKKDYFAVLINKLQNQSS